MTTTVKPLISSKYAEDSLTEQYIAVSCKTIIDKFTATNETAGNVTLSVYLVPTGGAADLTNRTLPARPIAPGECYTCPELVGHTLEPGGYISTIAGTASAITIRASGREIT
jgi:hypothetical protein